MARAVAMVSLAVTAVAACGPLYTEDYTPGSFTRPQGMPAVHATVGCLEVSVTRSEVSTNRILLAYFVGNRCTHHAPVDFTAVRATDASGATLEAYDPHDELAHRPRLPPLQLDRESIEYHGEAISEKTACIDLARLDDEAHPPTQVCLPAPVRPTEDAPSPTEDPP